MSPKIVTLYFFLFFLAVSPCIAGDSTSVAPGGGSGIEHDVETFGGDVNTSGGNVNTDGGWVRGASGIKTQRLYDYGSGNWIKVKDHFDMENNVLYDVRRVRVNDTWPNRDEDLASKRYVDAKSGSINCVTRDKWNYSYNYLSMGCYSEDRTVMSGGCKWNTVNRSHSRTTYSYPHPNHDRWVCQTEKENIHVRAVYVLCCKIN